MTEQYDKCHYILSFHTGGFEMRETAARELERWMHALQQVRTHGTLQTPRFLKPFHLATLAMEMRRQGDSFPVGSLSQKLIHYASRMHLWQAADLPAPLTVGERDASGQFLPATPLRSSREVDQYARQLVEIGRVQGADEETLESLEIAITELINNCFDHAGVGAGLSGLVCAQAWPAGNRAQIAFADPGIGIRRSLLSNPALADQLRTENACEIAATYGVTGKPGAHTGYGLSLARELIELNGGAFALYSQDECYFRGESDKYVSAGTPNWPGSLIVVEWKTDRDLRVDEVYRQWPNPAGMDDDDFF